MITYKLKCNLCKQITQSFYPTKNITYESKIVSHELKYVVYCFVFFNLLLLFFFYIFCYDWLLQTIYVWFYDLSSLVILNGTLLLCSFVYWFSIYTTHVWAAAYYLDF